jgi:hypothetical protein
MAAGMMKVKKLLGYFIINGFILTILLVDAYYKGVVPAAVDVLTGIAVCLLVFAAVSLIVMD